MASSVDLSGFFEKEQDISERTIRFTSHHSPKKLIEGIGFIVTQMGFLFRKRSGQLKVLHFIKITTVQSVFQLQERNARLLTRIF
ncbi:CBL-interacting protein kinase 1-like [Daucus carota subsp. sativus]|uniref:CBL-interacting protein kinase 1-like n=1 Tax=Daucus carota subsp. sativus TaxID=79200 RepID=UPI0030832F7D